MLVVQHIASFALLLALFSSRLWGVGTLDRTFDVGTGADGVVTSIHPLPDGKVLVGGLFTQFNRVARPGLVRLLSDGSVDTSFDAQIQISPQGGVATLRVDATGRIYVGGAFSRAGNRAATGLFRLQADGSIDTAFNASLPENSVVAAVAVAADGDTLWVGGLMVKGTTRTPLHRLTLNGAAVTGYTPPSAEAYDDLPIILALHPLPDGRVIAAGEFYSIGGVGRGNVARVRPDGTIDVSYTASVPLVWTQINDLVPASDKGDLYLVGDFINLNDFEPGVIGRVSPSGAVDRTFTFKVGKSSNNNRPIVNRLLPQADGRFVAVGNFQQVDGKDRHFLARIFSDGILDPSFTAATDNEVVTIAEESEGRWLVGGSFSRVNGQPAPTVARLQRQGDGPVFRLQPSPPPSC
jgi:uncharacterized delta-60 repeat protein